MGVLHQVEDDIGLRIVGVEALVGGGIVIFQQDHGILALTDLHIGGALVGTHHEGLRAGGGGAFGGIHVDRYEEVGLVAVGDVAALGQLHEAVGLPGIDDLHVGILLLDTGSELEGDVEIDLLFAQLAALGNRARIVPAVAGVDDDRTQADAAFGARDCGGCEGGQQHG